MAKIFGSTKYEVGVAGPQIVAGVGDPNGVVAAPVGSIYLRSDVAQVWQNVGLLTWTLLASSTAANVGAYSCPAGVAIRDAVYRTTANNVDKANATSVATIPVIGFVLSKPTAITCLVQYSGELGGFGGALVVGTDTYFLATTAPGGLIARNVDPGFPVALGNVVQEIGFAKDTSTLVIVIDRDYTVL